jgi:hypothetical protein
VKVIRSHSILNGDVSHRVDEQQLCVVTCEIHKVGAVDVRELSHNAIRGHNSHLNVVSRLKCSDRSNGALHIQEHSCPANAMKSEVQILGKL